MFHKLGIENTLDYMIDLYANNSPKISIVTQASFIRDNLVGPETGSSLSFNKLDSLIKASAEAVERRCSMLGAYANKNQDIVETWDLINNKKGHIQQKFSRILDGVSDTTGTAVHTNSTTAILNAVKELFEKNSLFLFWYGSIGKMVKPHLYSENRIYSFFTESGFKTSVFINESFKPLYTVIIIAYKEGDQFICGLGTDSIALNAINHAFEEAFLIGYMQYYAILVGLPRDENNWSNEQNIKHVKKMESLEYAEISSFMQAPLTLNCLVSSLPDFITELHVIFIEQFIVPNLRCVRVFSKDLINSLPLKRNIDFSLSINKNTIQLNKVELEKLPECPMS